jgi:hypothetical protein
MLPENGKPSAEALGGAAFPNAPAIFGILPVTEFLLP